MSPELLSDGVDLIHENKFKFNLIKQCDREEGIITEQLSKFAFVVFYHLLRHEVLTQHKQFMRIVASQLLNGK